MSGVICNDWGCGWSSAGRGKEHRFDVARKSKPEDCAAIKIINSYDHTKSAAMVTSSNGCMTNAVQFQFTKTGRKLPTW